MSEISTTVVLSTVEPGLLTKSTTTWNDRVLELEFSAVPVSTHAPDSRAHDSTFSSARTLRAGSNGTVPPGAITDECVFVRPGAGDAFEDEQLADSTEHAATRLAATNP